MNTRKSIFGQLARDLMKRMVPFLLGGRGAGLKKMQHGVNHKAKAARRAKRKRVNAQKRHMRRLETGQTPRQLDRPLRVAFSSKAIASAQRAHRRLAAQTQHRHDTIDASAIPA